MSMTGQTLGSIVLLSLISLLFSCGNNSDSLLLSNFSKVTVDSNNVKSTYLQDSSQWICEAVLLEPGIFVTWDFGYSEARHIFEVTESSNGELEGVIAIRQRVKDQDFDYSGYNDSILQIGSVYKLFLKRICNVSVGSDHEDFVQIENDSTSLTFLEVIYGGLRTYELTDNQKGIVQKDEK